MKSGSNKLIVLLAILIFRKQLWHTALFTGKKHTTAKNTLAIKRYWYRWHRHYYKRMRGLAADIGNSS